ncbi:MULTISPECIES: hypothetical protein [Luteibacter]|uniref:hypothetical protein n=1 Tax=Luteibacter TaxID=242605 RepID=UPI00055C375F|nr:MULTISPECIES: hypothetical protein [unclassified Luteibacter]
MDAQAQLSPLVETAKQLALLAETLERRSGAAAAQQEQAGQALTRAVTALRGDVDRLIQGAGQQVAHAAKQGVDASLAESAARLHQTSTAAVTKVNSAMGALDQGLAKARAALSRQITLGYFAIMGAMLLAVGGGGVVLWMEKQAYEDARARTAAANVSADTAAAFAQVNMTSCGGRPCVKLDTKSPRWGDKGQYVLVDTKALAK